ncbi:MAG TPA: AI-2E family transporter [Allosphingosinicella sp.]|nr:AI-2E family transporter [Allosphingosinicella sp.]
MSSKPPESDAGAAPFRRTRSILPRPGGPPLADGAAAAAEPETETTIYRRDRLLASLALMTGAGVLIALPFALRAGAEFFLPVTAALVIAIALVPALEWLERRRVPSGLAAFLCLMLFLIIANAAVAAIVFPASEWVKMLPERIDRVRGTLRPIFEAFSDFDAFINNVAHEFSRGPGLATQTVTVETPNSLLQIIATSAPFAIIQMFFATLVIYFFLAGWTKMRKRTITNRASFDGAMTTARVIQQVVDATSTYLGTITLVNLCLGVLVAFVLWLIGMESPLMWGGIVAVLNYIPYLGPIVAALLLGIGGLMVFVEPWRAMLPAILFVVFHLIEANIITPMVVGRKLTINPLMILLALSFWAWVWGTTGALLAVPLLIILTTVFAAAGKPDITGFLFEEGTLVQDPDEPRGQPPPGV